jgi:hypothetical protein
MRVGRSDRPMALPAPTYLLQPRFIELLKVNGTANEIMTGKSIAHRRKPSVANFVILINECKVLAYGSKGASIAGT